jgi:hypothetical protein
MGKSRIVAAVALSWARSKGSCKTCRELSLSAKINIAFFSSKSPATDLGLRVNLSRFERCDTCDTVKI